MNAHVITAVLLFTDLENSTPLWENHPRLMNGLMARHDALLQKAVAAHRGRMVKSTGDGFLAVFETAGDALLGAMAGQRALMAESWPDETGPLQVRMGLHIGESQERDGDLYGAEVNRAARVMDLGHGGQILASGAMAAVIGGSLPDRVTLLDLGQHRLKGLVGAEAIYQVQHPTLPAGFPPLKSLSVYKHNLPVQLSTFVGRQKELADVKNRLKETHLLTLLGPGGTGKTRLMLEAAEEVVGDFKDGVWLVELAPLTDPSLIAERVAAAMKIQEQPGRDILDTLIAYLRRKELLLLLDNVEHLVGEAAELSEQLLTHCPRLRILVTGRESLFISGETTLQIPSLSLPGRKAGASFEEVRASEGVQLFVTRAREIRPDFELTPENAQAIAEIVRRLDGIPLALELATARLRMLTVQQIAERLNDRFRLLTGGRRTALPRQQTLQALIDWSWNLLDDQERLLLQRLSVFSGGWSLAAAQVVAGGEKLDEYDIFDNLENLVNKSLVTVTYPVEGEARYGMLETIRQYGRDRLFESGEGERLRDRHAAYYVAFAEEAGPHLMRFTMMPWVEKIELELDNLRAVMAWTLEDRPELALRIAGSLLYNEVIWLTPREAQAWLEPALEATRSLLDSEDERVRKVDFIKALLGLEYAYGWQGKSAAMLETADECIQMARDNDQPRYLVMAVAGKQFANPFQATADAMQGLEEAVAIGRANKFELELAFALGAYAFGLYGQGRVEEAVSHLQEGREIILRINNPRMNASNYAVLSLLARMQGDLESAKSYRLLALENYESYGDRRGILMGQSDLAHILREEGNFDEAEFYYRQSIVAWQEFGQSLAVAHQVECFAYIAVARGKHERAAKLLGAAANARRQLNQASTDPREIADLEQAMAQLAAAMGEQQRDKLLAEGSLLSLDDAVEFALAAPPRRLSESAG